MGIDRINMIFMSNRILEDVRNEVLKDSASKNLDMRLERIEDNEAMLGLSVKEMER